MTKPRQLLVTSALPYANGSIHIGHLVEHIQTDVWVRFQKMRGHECYYMCADDAHGTAIMLTAEKEGMTPEDYIAAIKTEHIADFNRYGIEYDYYYSTHSEENKALSSEVFLAAQANGVIKQKKIEQLFDPQKAIFLADRYVKGTCPKCQAPDQYGDACEKCYATYDPSQLIDPKSAISGETPLLKESTHYFFELAGFQDTIEAWLSNDTVSTEVKNKCAEWLDAGLKDWDISRDKPYFGFTIPGETDRYFYVWLDAPIGYMATTQKWCQETGRSFDEIWKSNTYEIHHFIGKDIMYFHTLFWPAMLTTAGYQLPKKVHVHGFLTVNGEKMSKSRGTFILAKQFADVIDPIFLRYYIAAKLSSSMTDIDFNSEDFINRVNADIINKFANILSRTTAILAKNFESRCSEPDAAGLSLIEQLQQSNEPIAQHYENLDTHKAVIMIMKHADQINIYFNDNAPWSLVKTDPESAQKVCTSTLAAFIYLCIWLKPILPSLIQTFETTLNIPPLRWSTPPTLHHHTLNPYSHSYQRLKKEDLDQLLSTITAPS